MSPRAAWRLEQLGFAAVYDYTGGKADWIAAGLPTEAPGRIPRFHDRSLFRERHELCGHLARPIGRAIRRMVA